MSYGYLPSHAGDRVIYLGREYRLRSFDTLTGLADIISETEPVEHIPAVHLDHLEHAWCPRSHGGPGRPTDGDSP